ncbi:MAG TPA: AP2 domain-containing protein [Noviherbaspirillum sp.]|nr:AP2 domain-containing protein [Noviherbaspirillum sp.]
MTRHFSDSVHGGKRKALKAAIAFRDEMLTKLRDTEYASWLRRKRSNNTSGIVGVARYVNISQASGRRQEYPYWQAFWRDHEGRRHTRTFSVRMYGERKARKLAILARQAAVQELVGSAADRK